MVNNFREVQIQIKAGNRKYFAKNQKGNRCWGTLF